jgi:hypothetical protein
MASKILNELVGSCDSVGTLMKGIYDNGVGKGEQTAKDFTSLPAVREVITKFLLE